MKYHPAQLIAKKRDGEELTAAQIGDVVQGVVDGSLGDAQLGAFLMAVCCNGMTAAETAALTVAMRDSGRVLRHDGIARPKIDKHSTGGVGDKVSLLLAPLVAAAGVAVPMVSGRGLGHTGGTIDKLEAIPGYRTNLSIARFGEVMSECGYAMMAQSPDLAPADLRMYAVRDVSGTIESIPLIVSSILSKKLAEGISGLVMDVKCGRAAFMQDEHDARALMERIVATGEAAGIRVTALLTDMDHPLGRALGNALEVAEVLRALDGDCPEDLREVTLALGVEMLLLAKVADRACEARALLERLWRDGVAARVFRHNLELQGGDVRVLEEPDRMGRAPVVVVARAERAGWVRDVDPLALGRIVVDLGGGRRQPSDTIDPRVGLVLRRQLGCEVGVGDELAEVHAADDRAAEEAVGRVMTAMPVGDERRRRRSLVLGRSTGPVAP